MAAFDDVSRASTRTWTPAFKSWWAVAPPWWPVAPVTKATREAGSVMSTRQMQPNRNGEKEEQDFSEETKVEASRVES